MANRLAKVLSSLTKASNERLDQVISALEDDEKPSLQKDPQNVKELVEMYQKKQQAIKSGESSSLGRPSRKGKAAAKQKMYCLNFCRYRRAGFSYVRTTTNVQVPGFRDDDTYDEVVEKGARGLGLKDLENLQFVVSGGVVNDAPLDGGEKWTLGGYVEGIGGQAVRGKKTFGLLVMESDDEDDEPPQKKKKMMNFKPLHHSTALDQTWGTIAKPIEIEPDAEAVVCLDSGFVVKYCPVESGMAITAVVALGREGVWRLDFQLSDLEVKARIKRDLFALQPEEDSEYALIEFKAGGKTLLAATNIDGQTIPFSDIQFKTATTLIHSKLGVAICTDSHSPLLCISPHHGRTSYTWEKCQNGMWERINVSSSCCLIFVSCAGTYRCSSYTEDTTDKITFEVTKPACTQSPSAQ